MTVPKPVLFIIPSVNYGGAELLMIQQVQWLQQKGWPVFMALLSHNNEPELVRSLNLPEHHLLIVPSSEPVLNGHAVAFALKHQSVLVRFVKMHHIKTVVAHLPLSHFWGRLIKLQCRNVRLVVYHHSMQYQANPLNTAGKKIFNRLQKQLATYTDDASICVSNAVKDNIERHFILKNAVVLYNAVQDRTYDIPLETCHSALDSGNRPVNLVVPGRLHAAKGHLFFLAVFKQLVADGAIKLRLVIAGGGPLEEEIRRFISDHRLENHVTVTSTLSNDNLLRRMCEADLVIIPSLSEGMGIVAVEALMLGKTVVASDAGGLKEVIRHGQNGYLFRMGDAGNCRSVLQDVLSTLPASFLPSSTLRSDYQSRFSFDAHMTAFAGVLAAKKP